MTDTAVPRTEAGRELAHLGCCTSVDEVLAIEDEARAAALDEVAAAVKGLRVVSVLTGAASVEGYVKSDYLAAIEALRKPE